MNRAKLSRDSRRHDATVAVIFGLMVMGILVALLAR